MFFAILAQRIAADNVLCILAQRIQGCPSDPFFLKSTQLPNKTHDGTGVARVHGFARLVIAQVPAGLARIHAGAAETTTRTTPKGC